ncbi:MAG: tRNA lysidine(34) synthetase TilS [Blastocatellia bacterium]
MTKLEKKLQAALRRLGVSAQEKIVVAVSGGADSTALLDALVRWRERKGLPGAIIVAHLNHQLRGEESDEDERFVRKLADQLNLPVCAERIAVADHARSEKKNLEATARRLRYDFLRRVAEQREANFVFTAHTLDDQAETVLMRLLRGSGAEGLRGIHRIVVWSEKLKLARPMLAVMRGEVIEYCEHYKLAFRSDSSNLSIDFTRNRIRHELLPMLETFNPRIKKSLARASELIADDEDFLQPFADKLLEESRESARLNIKPLQKAHPAVVRRVLRQWLRGELGSLLRINATHVAAIENLATRSQSGRFIQLPGFWRVEREFDTLELSCAPIPECALMPIPSLTGGAKIVFGDFELSYFSSVPRARISAIVGDLGADCEFALLRQSAELDGLWVRVRNEGDAYVPEGHRHAAKLKTLMIRRKIPRSQRDDYPILVTADDRIVWAPGLPVAGAFAPESDDSVCALVTAQRLSETRDSHGWRLP